MLLTQRNDLPSGDSTARNDSKEITKGLVDKVTNLLERERLNASASINGQPCTIHLTGVVGSFYQLQLAQEIAKRQMPEGWQVCNDIKVLT